MHALLWWLSDHQGLTQTVREIMAEKNNEVSLKPTASGECGDGGMWRGLGWSKRDGTRRN
jgi:hypothetical protein